MKSILYKTNNFRIESEYEVVSLVDNLTEETIFQCDFYGGANCGLLDLNNKWAVIGGDTLIIWTTQSIFTKDEIKWVHSLRMKNSATIEALTDPWSKDSAIWEIDTTTFNVRRTKYLNDYKDKKYTENVIW